MIKFACITPHPPILIPSIGKENLAYLEKTKNSLEELAKNAKEKKIKTLIIISPHGQIEKDYFTINASPDFEVNFENFGDFSTKFNAKSDTGLIYGIKEELEEKNLIKTIGNSLLDHGSAVPLYYFIQELKDVNIVPIYYSDLNLEENYNFGKELKKLLARYKKNIGIIASGDLSHRLNKNAPAGYSPRGAKFDKKLIDLLKNKKSQDILEMDEELIHEAGECGLRSIAVLLGLMEDIEYDPKLLSYEGPFGVGYLTMDFEIKNSH